MSFIVTSFIVARTEIGFPSVIKSPVLQFYLTSNYQQQRYILILNMSRIIYEGDTIHFSIEKTAPYPFATRLLGGVITFIQIDNIYKLFIYLLSNIFKYIDQKTCSELNAFEIWT